MAGKLLGDLFILFQTNGEISKTKHPILLMGVKSGVFFCNLLIISIYCGAYGTRTRDPMRDRHVF